MAPFEVMISESQERMLAVVRPERWDDVREVCERWGLPVAVIGRVTDDGDVAIVEGGLDRDGRPDPGAVELARIPAPALTSDAIVHDRLAAPPARRRAAPAPGAPAEPSDGLPERGMDPGAVLLGAARRAEPVEPARGSTSSTTARPGEHGRRARSRGAAVIRIKGTTKALVAATDGNQAVGRARPVARGRAERRRGHPQRVDHRRPAARRDELPELRRPDPPGGVLAAPRGRPRPRRRLPGARPAGHRRQRLALQRVAGRARSRPTPEIGVVGLLDDVATRVGPAFVEAGDIVVLVGRVDARAGRERLRRSSPGVARRTARRRSTSAARRPLQRFIREAIARGLVASAQDVAGGGLAVAIAEGCIWGADDRASGRSSGCRSPARRPSSCSARARRAIVLSCRPRHAPALDPARPPARAAGRGARARSAATGSSIELAGQGATGAAEERGSRVADAVDVPIADLRHAWEHGPRPGARRGRPTARCRRTAEMCGVFGVVLPAGREARGRRRSPRSACSPSSTAARSRPAWPSATARADALQGPRDDRLGPRRAAPARACAGNLAIAHCRYSTTGSTVWENAQPTFRLGPRRALAIGHNGNLVNTRELLGQLRGGRARLPASTDTELLTALLADEPAADTVEALLRVLPRVRGAYSLVVLDERRVIGVRDPFGFRPLVLGRLPAPGRPTGPSSPACGATTTPAPAGSSAPRRPASTSSGRSTSATSSRARSSSSSPAARRARSASPRRRRRCASSS